MSINNKITQLYRPARGATGVPTGFTALTTDAGLLAINFSDPKAGLYVWDGTAWIHLNEKTVIASQNITIPNGTDIGTAYAAIIPVPTLTGDVIIATYNGDAYILTNKLAPTAAASWTSLGSSTAFADVAEAGAGTEPAKAIAPNVLRAELARALGIMPATLNTGTAGITTGGGVAGAVGKFPLLNSAGKLDASFLSIQGLNFIGATDMSGAIPAPPTVGFKNGDVYTHSGSVVAPSAAWGFNADVLHVEPGDMALYDGTVWHHIATAADLSNVVLKAGANTMANDASLIWAAGASTDSVLIDGNDAANAVIQNFNLKTCTLNGGTF